MRILLVEDDRIVAKAVEAILIEQHYVVDAATDGQTGLEFVEVFTYDLIVLDLMLPKLNGIGFCQQLRARGHQVPILLLTAQTASADKVQGLDAGADDYVVKPFEASELLARIRALLRRSASSKMKLLEWENLRVDPGICEATYNGQTLPLTPKEYRLLELFLRHDHRVFSRSAILDHLWSSEEVPREDTVTAHIKALRRKLKQAGAPEDLIETVYGQGYRLKQMKPQTDAPMNLAIACAIQQATKARLAVVWEKYRGLSRDRFTVLQQATALWQKQMLSDEQRKKAYIAAHKLAGALGIFGFAEASHVAKSLEELFQTQEQLDSTHQKQLIHALAVIQETFDRSIVNPPQTQVTYAANFQLPLLLVIDRPKAQIDQLVALAERLDFWVQFASNILAAGELIHLCRRPNLAKNPDAVVLNLSLTDVTDEGVKLLAAFANQTPPVPVLFLTEQADLSTRIKMATLTAHAFLPASLSLHQVFEAVKRSRPSLQFTTKVMVVDDDLHLLASLRILLEPLGIQLNTLSEPQQFWQTLAEFVPDVLILDVQMPHFNGIELCQVLRHSLEWKHLPVLFLTAHTDTTTVNEMLAIGANDCISKSLPEVELVSRLMNHLARIRLFQGIAQATSCQDHADLPTPYSVC